MNQIGLSIAFDKHIAFITPGFAADESDTTCITALQLLVEELTAKGVRITVFALHYPFVDTPYSWKGVNVFPINGRNRSFYKYFRLFARLKKTFLGVHSNDPFAAIHAFWLNEATLFAQELGRKTDLPVLATTMGQDSLKTNRYLKRLNFQELWEVIAPCRFQADVLQRNTGVQATIVPFGVREGAQTHQKKHDIIGVGNLIEVKNFDYFMDVCKALNVQKVDFSAILVGEGPQRTELLRKIELYNLRGRVQLVGKKGYDETLRLIGESRVLLHTSVHEGFGMVLIEALAQGTQVLSAPVGIAAESVDMKHLTFRVEEDALILSELMKESNRPAFLYSLSNCADGYIKKYEGALLK